MHFAMQTRAIALEIAKAPGVVISNKDLWYYLQSQFLCQLRFQVQSQALVSLFPIDVCGVRLTPEHASAAQ